MKLKRRLIANRIVTIVLGLALLLLGLPDNDMMISMGTAVLVVSVLLTIRTIVFIKNDKKFGEFEKAYYDERNIFIAQKSYSFAYWVSLYAEFVALCVLSYMKLETYAVMISYIMCGQLILYVAARMVFNKKY